MISHLDEPGTKKFPSFQKKGARPLKKKRKGPHQTLSSKGKHMQRQGTGHNHQIERTKVVSPNNELVRPAEKGISN